MGTTGQNAAITVGHGVSTIATGTPVALVPGTSQLKTPPRPVRLVTVPNSSPFLHKQDSGDPTQ